MAKNFYPCFQEWCLKLRSILLKQRSRVRKTVATFDCAHYDFVWFSILPDLFLLKYDFPHHGSLHLSALAVWELQPFRNLFLAANQSNIDCIKSRYITGWEFSSMLSRKVSKGLCRISLKLQSRVWKTVATLDCAHYDFVWFSILRNLFLLK